MNMFERIVSAALPLLSQLRTDVNALQLEVRRMVTKQEEFDARVNEVITRFDAATNVLAQEIRELREAQQAGTIDPTAAFQRLGEIAVKLEELGKDPENPFPAEV